MITLRDVLSKPPSRQLHKTVVCLKGASYPLLFGRFFARQFSQLQQIPLESLTMKTDNSALAMAGLQTSFLGQRRCYWLGSDQELSKKQLEYWQRFLLQYNGPHIILFCTSTIPKKMPDSWQIIELPDTVDARLFQKIAQVTIGKSSSLSAALFKETKGVSIDAAVMLTQYGVVVGKGEREFVKEWLPHMLVADTSLFALSQTLFERKASSFFSLWKKVALQYSPPFWTMFWSEQMWRAYWYVLLQRKNKPADAKKIGYRLPFSFLRYQWRNYSVEDFQKAHTLLYDIDYRLKNGGSEYQLDLFFSLFLT